MTRFLIAFAWIWAAATIAFSMEPEGRIGDLTYDAARWRVSPNGDAFQVSCRKGGCDTAINVTFAPGEPSVCSGAAMMQAAEDEFSPGSRDPKLERINRPGFDIYAIVAWTGCRNARPPSVHACTAYKGRIYRFDAPVFGCRGGPGFSDGALDFLKSLNGR